MPTRAKKFSTKLRVWRASRTQREAATTLGVNWLTYRNWEYGRNQPASYACSMIESKIGVDKTNQD